MVFDLILYLICTCMCIINLMLMIFLYQVVFVSLFTLIHVLRSVVTCVNLFFLHFFFRKDGFSNVSEAVGVDVKLDT